MLIHLLKETDYPLATEKLEVARNSGRRLTTACDLLIEELSAQADKVCKNDLVEGHRYGVFDVSHYAVACRDGQMIPNHGEIYLYAYIYRDGCLTEKNAWGIPYSKNIGSGMLLVELP